MTSLISASTVLEILAIIYIHQPWFLRTKPVFTLTAYLDFSMLSIYFTLYNSELYDTLLLFLTPFFVSAFDWVSGGGGGWGGVVRLLYVTCLWLRLKLVTYPGGCGCRDCRLETGIIDYLFGIDGRVAC